MKYVYQLLALITLVTGFTSCKKEKHEQAPLASLNVIHAIFGGGQAKLNAQARLINLNNAAQFSLPPGSNSLYIYPAIDSLHPYYNQLLVAGDRDGYSLYLTGTPANVESVLIKEEVPQHLDSTVGVRFINLAPNMPSVNITLSATPSTNEVSSLAFKQFTEYKSYAGLYNSNYVFQVRNAASPASPVANYSLTAANVPRFANITLAVVQNASGVSVIRVNNDR